MYMLVKVRFPAFGDGSLSLTIDWWKKKKSLKVVLLPGVAVLSFIHKEV